MIRLPLDAAFFVDATFLFNLGNALDSLMPSKSGLKCSCRAIIRFDQSITSSHYSSLESRLLTGWVTKFS
ncbi:MAG: hypothetical protein CMQ23_01860 [Gammaproteobacteria bacterium]|nr:hypothetical protein [Gammaproteobacteria bacterium]